METITTSDVKLKPCSVCGKEIEEPKLRIHEATCARNNYKCPKCGEIVPKSEKEHHEQDNHQTAKCIYCHTFESEKKGLQQHLGVCEMKPKPCLYCDLSIGGDKYNEHLAYCGSKTTKCPECKQNVMNRELEDHVISGACGFHKEIEVGKAQRELMKFQEEEQKRVASQMMDKQRQERMRKEEEYVNRQMHMSGMPGVVQNKPQAQPYVPQASAGLTSTGPGQSDPTNLEDADQQMIAKLLQEELDAQEAQNLVNQQEDRSAFQNYDDDESSFQEQPNVRPPTDIYEDQMIGGPASGSRPYTYQSTVNFPGGFRTVQQTTYSSSGGPAGIVQPNMGFNFGQEGVQQPYYQNFEEDSEMREELNEEEALNRAIAESMGQQNQGANIAVHGQGISQNPNNTVLDTEEEIMRQIMEQSKHEK